MNDSSLNHYQQLITSRNIDLSKNNGVNNPQEIELVKQNYPQQEAVKQVQAFNENETESPPDTPEQQQKQSEKQAEKKGEKQVSSQCFYIAYLVLLIPICASITGLADTEQIIYGSIPKYLKDLFIGILVISIVNLIYLLYTQFFILRPRMNLISTKFKCILVGIWLIWNIAFFVVGGLSFSKYEYMIKDCQTYYSEIWDRKAIDLYSTAQNTLCTQKCPCDMKFPFILSDDLQKKISPFINNSKMVVNISHCPGMEQKDDLFYQLKQAENNWKCSGICSTYDLYYFTDINRGMPEEQRPCLQVAIEDYLPQVVNLLKFSSIFTGVVQSLVILYFLFGSSINKPTPTRASRSDSNGGDSQKYSSGGSGGSEIDVDDTYEKPDDDEYFNETNLDTESISQNRGTDYFAKMFSAKSKISRQSTRQSGESGYRYSISSNQFMQMLRKSKLPNEQGSINNSQKF